MTISVCWCHHVIMTALWYCDHILLDLCQRTCSCLPQPVAADNDMKPHRQYSGYITHNLLLDIQVIADSDYLLSKFQSLTCLFLYFTDCSMSTKEYPGYTCTGRSLLVKWPTDTLYTQDVDVITDELSAQLTKRLTSQSDNFAQLLVLTNQPPYVLNYYSLQPPEASLFFIICSSL